MCFDLLPSTFPLKLDQEQNAAVNKDDRLSSLYYYYRFFLAFQFFFPGQKVTRKQQKYDFFCLVLDEKQRKLYTLDVWNGIYTVGIYEFFFFFCYLKVDNGLASLS